MPEIFGIEFRRIRDCPRKQTARKRPIGENADSKLSGGGQSLALNVAAENRILDLKRRNRVYGIRAAQEDAVLASLYGPYLAAHPDAQLTPEQRTGLETGAALREAQVETGPDLSSSRWWPRRARLHASSRPAGPRASIR